MSIQLIRQLRNCKVFKDFSWPRTLRPFSRFNLIYGLNGTGKTTISRILGDLEHRRTPTVGDVTLVVDGQEIDGPQLSMTMSFP